MNLQSAILMAEPDAPDQPPASAYAAPRPTLAVAGWERGLPYGATQRVNLPALVASATIVSLFLGAFLTLNTLPDRKPELRPTVVELLSLESPPPPSVPEPRRAPDVPVAAQPEQAVAAPQVAPPLVAPSSPLPIASPIVASAVPAGPAPAPAPATPAPAPAPHKPVEDGGLGARMLSAPPPKYPLESRRKREQGIVALSVLLGTDGRVETLSVSSSSGFDRLDKAALKAVREWRWAPLVRNGAPVQVRGIVTIPFQLRG
ncbi:energy transducer TonB [Sphingosinicella sp. BN140058]|uniref:energy transducer TonB n=1 Tax=Sphingosinicella sp. BN140058 TaxID=1892855 RepID=UPI001FB105C2|nr:energy transducer TonB [Sphingosinicella sp. BN140058]